jgi:hypothetical protein
VASASPGVVKEWVNRPRTDYLIAGIGVALALGLRSTGVHFLGALDADARLLWLQTLAGATIAVFGVAVTATTLFYVVSPGPRLASAMARVGLPLTGLLVSAVSAAGLGSLLFLGVMPLYARDRVTFVSAVVLGTAIVVSLRMARLLWLFARLLRAFVAEDAPIEEPIVRDWVAPTIGPDDYSVPERRTPGPRVRSRS